MSNNTQCRLKSPANPSRISSDGDHLVGVRGFEPLTPCMPLTISTFSDVRSCSNLLAITATSSLDVC